MAGEKLFENKVKKFFHQVGIYSAGTPNDKMVINSTGWFIKFWGGGFSKAGIPDLICCVNGIFISVELKAIKGHASELQKKNTSMINESNGIGVILFPEGFEEFKKLIQGVINCKHHIQELNALRVVHTSTKCVILTK